MADSIVLKERDNVIAARDILQSDITKPVDMVPKKPCILQFQVAAKFFAAASALCCIAQYLLKIIQQIQIDKYDTDGTLPSILKMNFGKFQSYFVSLLNWIYSVLLLISVCISTVSRTKQWMWKNMEFLTAPIKVCVFMFYIVIAQAPQALFQKIDNDAGSGPSGYDAFNLAQSVLLVANCCFLSIVLIYGIMTMCSRKSAINYYLALGVEFQLFKLGL